MPGSTLDERALAIFEAAETVILPITPEIAALKAMHALLEYLGEAGSVGLKSTFVLNNLFAREILKLRDVESFLGSKIAVELPYDPFLYLKAVNEGVPIVTGAPRSVPAERLTRLSAIAFGEEASTLPGGRRGEEVGRPVPATPLGRTAGASRRGHERSDRHRLRRVIEHDDAGPAGLDLEVAGLDPQQQVAVEGPAPDPGGRPVVVAVSDHEQPAAGEDQVRAHDRDMALDALIRLEGGGHCIPDADRQVVTRIPPGRRLRHVVSGARSPRIVNNLVCPGIASGTLLSGGSAPTAIPPR